MLGFIFPLPVLFDEGVSTDTLLTLCLLTQAGSAPACGNIIYLLFRTNLILSLEDVLVLQSTPGKLPSRISVGNEDHLPPPQLIFEDSGIRIELSGHEG